MENLKNGKLSIKQLNENIFSHIGKKRDDVLTVPNIGQDCGYFLGNDDIISVTSDPITATSKDIGKLAVIVNINDVIASFAVPIAMTVTILAPNNTSDDEIKNIMQDISKECKKYDVQIIGGHSEITSAVNQIVVSITAFGRLSKEKYKSIKPIKAGQKIYMTKEISLEGTMVIVNENEDELKDILCEKEIKDAKKFIDKISIYDDAKILGNYNISLMHDVTEGGIFGAIYELMSSVKKGCIINYNDIKINPVTKKVCTHYDIDPTRLLSSGCLIFITDDILDKKINGISFFQIGVVLDMEEKIYIKDGKQYEISEPYSDELYKVV